MFLNGKIVFRKIDFERYLNNFKIPDEILQNSNYKIKVNSKYGSWLRRTNPAKFNQLYEDYINKNNAISLDSKDSSLWSEFIKSCLR